MLSPRRSRAFVFVPIIFFLIIWYYHDFAGLAFQLPRIQIHEPQSWQAAVIPSPVSLTTAGPTDRLNPSTASVEHLQSQTTPSTPTVEPTQIVGSISTSTDLVTSPSDILSIIKTGASTIWRRMPLHLITTLANDRVPNSVIYSDLNEKLASNVETIDVLENVSELIKTYDHAAYESYIELQSPDHINTYREHGQLPGDEPAAKPGNTPGWLLDRYKFLPMLSHAQRNWPDLK